MYIRVSAQIELTGPATVQQHQRVDNNDSLSVPPSVICKVADFIYLFANIFILSGLITVICILPWRPVQK